MADTGTAGELLGWLWAAFKILSLLAIIYLAVVEARRYRKKALAKRQEGDSTDEAGGKDSAPKAGASGQRRGPDQAEDEEVSQEGAAAEPKEQ